MLYGAFKKLVVADRMAPAVLVLARGVFGTGAEDALPFALSGRGAAGFFWAVPAVMLCYGIQLYADFTGGIDLVIGFSEIFGIRLSENFDLPYFATSLKDFWRRWHMSLTTWFREYVYIPLGGNRKGGARRNLNIMIVWALTGLWHGAGWNFVLWGIWFGVLLIAEKKWILGKAWAERLPGWLRQVLTYLPVLLGWGMFTGKWQVFPAMAGVYGLAPSAGAALECAAFLPMLLVCMAVSFLPSLKIPDTVRKAAPLLLVLCLAALAAQGYAHFVYFQF
jgi:alginate O-acetyltransferase complex protein AlgI